MTLTPREDRGRPFLVVFLSHYGQCARIATRIAESLRQRGNDAVIDPDPERRCSLDDFAGVFIVAPVYDHQHPVARGAVVRAARRPDA